MVGLGQLYEQQKLIDMSEFREIVGKNLNWQNVSSNFQLLRTYGWHDSPVIRRIFSLARHLGYKSVLMDDVSDCVLCEVEGNAIRACNPNYHKSQVVKCSFIKYSVSDGIPKQEDFVGYAILKKDSNAKGKPIFLHVYESVMKLPFGEANEHKKDNNYFVHCSRDYNVMTTQGAFHVRGVLFAQQNGISSLCAHVAIRSVLDCLFGNRFSSYDDYNTRGGVCCADLQKAIGSKHIEMILESYGCKFRKHAESNVLDPLTPDFDNVLYGSIESGLPALLVFNVERQGYYQHIIPFFGHSFSSHTWIHNLYFAEYFAEGYPLSAKDILFVKNQVFPYHSSENWVGDYIVHDGNLGAYFTIPRRLGKWTNQNRILYTLNGLDWALSAQEAESLGLAYLHNFYCIHAKKLSCCFWFEEIFHRYEEGQSVLRTIQVSKEDYIHHLETMNMGEDVVNLIRDERFPTYFWMIEISCTELFPTNRHKLGEVLLCSNQRNVKDAFMAIRFPGAFEIKTINNTIKHYNTQVREHTDVFCLSPFGAH